MGVSYVSSAAVQSALKSRALSCRAVLRGAGLCCAVMPAWEGVQAAAVVVGLGPMGVEVVGREDPRRTAGSAALFVGAGGFGACGTVVLVAAAAACAVSACLLTFT